MREDVEPESCTRASKHKEVYRWQNRAIDDDEVRAQAHCWHNPSERLGTTSKAGAASTPWPGPPSAWPAPARRTVGTRPEAHRRAACNCEVGNVGSRLRLGRRRMKQRSSVQRGGRQRTGAAAATSTRAGALRGQSARPVRCHLCKCHGPEAALCIVYGHTPVRRKHEAACGVRSSHPRGAVRTVRRWGQGVPRDGGDCIRCFTAFERERLFWNI